jgi:glycosyltransferase involved in cell wall biosynthesis
MGFSALPFAELVKTPTVHTLHGNLTDDFAKIFGQYRHQPYISISDAQRQYKELNYVRTVYNAIDISKYPFIAQPSEPPYLAFLGRISPEKGPQLAIEIAKQTGYTLKMAGKVDAVDVEFYEAEVAPHVDGKQIEFLGEVSHEEKVELLARAAVTLFPITWREPFGLVMIESMATGTPIIGINLGSVSEVIADGKTGFVCQSWEEMASKIPLALALDRQSCRDEVERRFSIAQMVDGYEAAYREILEGRFALNGSLSESKSGF